MKLSKEEMLVLIRALSSTYVIQEDQKLIYNVITRMRDEIRWGSPKEDSNGKET